MASAQYRHVIEAIDFPYRLGRLHADAFISVLAMSLIDVHYSAVLWIADSSPDLR